MSATGDANAAEPREAVAWRDVGRRLGNNRAAIASIVILITIAALSALAPWLTHHTYDAQDLRLGAASPSAQHWLGTDNSGRDIWTRLLFGGRISMMVGLCATAVSLLIGVTYGAVAGYAGGRVDTVLMRIVDILYALPFTIFVILLTVVFERSILLLFVAIGAVEWLTMARIVRGQVLAVRRQEYISAAVVLGFSIPRIVFRHIIPNVLGPIIVYTTLTIPQVILLESFLSFLGLGVKAPMPSWGLLIRDGAAAMETYPWLLVVPAVMLSLTLFALNFLGDALRDALDPRVARRT